MDKHIALFLVLWTPALVEAPGGAWTDGWGGLLTGYVPGLDGVKSIVSTVSGLATTVDNTWTTVSDSLVKTADAMSGSLRNFMDEVDTTNLSEFAETYVLPLLVQSLPYRSCVRGVEVQFDSSYLLLTNSILRMRPKFTTGANIVNDAREKTMDVEIYLELQKARIQYDFRFKNDIMLYNLDKSGKLLLTQRKNMRISLFGSVTKKLSQFKELRDKEGMCVIRLEKVKTTIGGFLEHTKIKYYSVGIGATQRYVSGALRTQSVEDEIKEHLSKALTYHIEKELRQSKYFCKPSYGLEKLVCNNPVFRSLALNGK